MDRHQPAIRESCLGALPSRLAASPAAAFTPIATPEEDTTMTRPIQSLVMMLVAAIMAVGIPNVASAQEVQAICGTTGGSPEKECAQFGLPALGKDDFEQVTASRCAQLALVKAGQCFTIYKPVVPGQALSTFDGKDISHVTYCGEAQCPGSVTFEYESFGVDLDGNGTVDSLETVTKVYDANDNLISTTKSHCDNGVGNGPDCRPGRARCSNDDLGGTPGSPGCEEGQ